MRILTDLLLLTIAALITTLGGFIAWRLAAALRERGRKKAAGTVPRSDDPYQKALTALRLALEEAGFCVWGNRRKEGQLCDYLGVNLDWPDLPDDKIHLQVREIRNILAAVGKAHNLHPMMAQPDIYAGGVMAVMCGFATEEYTARYGAPPGWETHSYPEIPPDIHR